MTKPLIKTNLQFQHGQFKKEIGFWIGRGGERVERVWWLGPDERQAERVANVLLSQWQRIKAEGRKVWTDADVWAVETFLNPSPATPSTPGDALRIEPIHLQWKYSDGGTWKKDGSGKYRVMPPVHEPLGDFLAMMHQDGYEWIKKPEPSPDALNLHAAIDLYVAHLESRPDLSAANLDRQRRVMETLKKTFPDRPVIGIGFGELTNMVHHFLSRPVSPKTGKPLAVPTVVTIIAHLRQLFTWLDDSSRWETPRKFEKIFRFKKRSIMTHAEQRKAGEGPKGFTVPELATLWANANERQRCLMGTAFFTGMTQQELAILERGEVVKVGGKVFVDHIRGKTGIRGRYVIPEPVARLLLDGMETTGEVAFLTADGKPLVWYAEEGKKHKTDSVAQMWRRLLRKCPKVRRLGFKYLRKTGATLIADLTGSDRLAELYLSHSGQSVAKKHYIERTEKAFDQLADAIEKMRQHLEPMFDGSAVIKESSPKVG